MGDEMESGEVSVTHLGTSYDGVEMLFPNSLEVENLALS